MGLIREINLAGRSSQVQNFVPGDNITFAPQSDGSIRINGEAGGGGGESYTAGPGIQISQNEISADVRDNMVSISETNPSTNAHAVGEYIINSNTLYKVIAAIAADDALVVGANIEQTSIGKELAEDTCTVTLPTEWGLSRAPIITFSKFGRLVVSHTNGSVKLKSVGLDEQVGVIPERFRPKAVPLFSGVDLNTFSNGFNAMISLGGVLTIRGYGTVGTGINTGNLWFSYVAVR